MTSMAEVDTPRVTISTTYHGVTVSEDYRWLEDATSEQTRAWTAAQNARTRAFLRGLPSYDAVRARAAEIATAESVSWGRTSYGTRFEGPRRGGSTYFVLKREPPKQQPFLVKLADLDDISSAAVLVDPNTIDESGETTIDWFVPSPDGRLVAASLSAHGTEDGTLHVFDTESGERVDVLIPASTVARSTGRWPGRGTLRHSGTRGFQRRASALARTSRSSRRYGAIP
jgi:prolyl oligopeptidase